MWGKITRVIKNWAYEEVEIEVENEVKEEIKTNEVEKRIQPKKSITKAKIAYKYPQNIPLRFPLIQENLTNENKSRKQKINETKKIRNKEYNSVYNAGKNLSPTVSYQRKRDLSKMEDIPAYLRKDRTKSNPDAVDFEKQRVERKQKEQIEKQQKAERIKRGTTPDELDAIYKKLNEKPKKSNEIIEENPSEKIPIINDVRKDYTKKTELILDSKPLYLEVEEKSNQDAKDKLDIDLIKPSNNRLKETSILEIKKPVKTVQQEEIMEPKEASIPLHLLNDSKESNTEDSDEAWLQEQSDILEETLRKFNVGASVVNVTQGPTVTSFEVRPNSGVKVSRIRNLSDDLKLNLAAKDIRIQAPIPGKNTVGIEVPNKIRQVVSFQDVVENETFKNNEDPLPIALGLTVEGEPLITSINKMPHGLIAGATGSGKSVCINTILLSLMYKCHHDDVKFLLIDPKMIELSPYNGIPHLIAPVITDAKAASASLKWAVNEMESRYQRFVDLGVRDISRYNEKITDSADKMPYLVIVIDELADLMMVSPQDVEDAICRIAQKARAAGIHLLVATQRPSVDVITGLIKANIPTRIAFSVSSQVDSRTILDEGGAEKLLGKGDMLFMESGSNKLLRLQGPFVSDEEIERVTNHARSLAKPVYLFEEENLLESLITEEEDDELLGEVIHFITEQNRASTSLLQRRFRIGYNRAARIIDTLESRGLISGQNGSQPRDVLINEEEIEALNL